MLHLKKNNIDDLMRGTFLKLLAKKGVFEVSSTKGRSLEVFGATLELTNPRCRLSRSLGRARVFSALGELLWYLSGSNSIEQIRYYIPRYDEFSDDGKTAHGAYGPRIFKPNFQGAQSMLVGSQWDNALKRLKDPEKHGTRNAVIQVFSSEDIEVQTKDRPCTCSIQFVIRNGSLLMQVHMRSNDAFLGLPHDLFAFTLLQEIAAREVGVGLGSYLHSVGSLHLYADSEKLDHRKDAQAYIDEALYTPTPMPAMPSGNPWPSIEAVLLAEQEIRADNLNVHIDQKLDPYWHDIVLLLKVYGCSKHMPEKESEREIRKLLKDVHSPVFELYIRDRLAAVNLEDRDLFDEGTD